MATFPAIPGYELDKELKSGGFGTTFLAVQKSLERRCVIKVLNHDDDETVKRFINEARAANAIRNPGIVQIYEIGTTQNSQLYLSMEYIDKGSLWDKLNASAAPALPSRGFFIIIKQIASILNDAHGEGIFHRDLSPGNIMFSSDPLMENGERVKIIDFGLAKVPKSIQLGGTSPVSTSATVSFGTRGFMAPEAYQNVKAVTSACDVWSLGAIVYYALTRQYADIDWTAHDPPQPLKQLNTNVPQWLSDLVDGMLTFKAAARPSMEQIITVIDSRAAQRINGIHGLQLKNESAKLVRLNDIVANKSTVSFHAHSKDHAYGPVTLQASVVALDELEEILTIKFPNAASSINIPINSILRIWTHKTGIPCMAIEGLFVGSPPSDWWYFAK